MPKPWHLETTDVRIRKVCVGPYENNAYIVADARSNVGVIVDAASEAVLLVEESAGIAVRAILTTHGHLDHVAAARETADRLGVPFLMDPADAAIAGIAADGPLPRGRFEVGSLSVDVITTPGHTPGSACFAVPGVVFSGDTLFPGGPGATRFPYSDFDQIIASIETRLFTLDDATLVMPGHGLDTTIGAERPSLEAWRARGW